MEIGKLKFGMRLAIIGLIDISQFQVTPNGPWWKV